MIVLGVGAGLTILSAAESAMGSLPGRHTGVGSATNGAFLQIGGVLGAVVIDSGLNTRYQDEMASAFGDCRRPMTANSATATADGMVVTLVGELVKVMSPPKMPSNSTASHIVMFRAAQDPGTRSRDAMPWRTGLSVVGSCVMTVMAVSFRQFHACSSQASRPGPSAMT